MDSALATDIGLSAGYALLLLFAGFGFYRNRRSFYLVGMLVFFLRCIFTLTKSSSSSLLNDLPGLMWGVWGFWFVVEWFHEWSVKVQSPYFRRVVVMVVSWCVLVSLSVVLVAFALNQVSDSISDSNSNSNSNSDSYAEYSSVQSALKRSTVAIMGAFFITEALGMTAVGCLLYDLVRAHYRTKRPARGFTILFCGVCTVIFVLLRGLLDLAASPRHVKDNNNNNNNDDDGNGNYNQSLSYAIFSANSTLVFQEMAPSLTLLLVQILLPVTLNPGAHLTLLPPPMVADDDFLLDIAVSRKHRHRKHLSLQKLVDDPTVRKIAMHELNDQPTEVLGRGSSGIVFKAMWSRPEDNGDPDKAIPVAVKLLKLPHASLRQDALDTFVLEVLLTARLSLRSDYICFLHGVVLDRFESDLEIRLVSELMQCDLAHICTRLSPRQKVIALFHIAKGLEFLHTCKPPIIHRDLKTANILVGGFSPGRRLSSRFDSFSSTSSSIRSTSSTSSIRSTSSTSSSTSSSSSSSSSSQTMICKITDLGVSTLASEWLNMTRIGTPYVMAPEMINLTQTTRRKISDRFYSSSNNLASEEEEAAHQPYGTPVDIYAWAIIANEVWTGNPFLMTPDDRARYKFQSKFDDAVTTGALRPIIPSTCPQALASLIRDCWHADPSHRPSSEELVTRLTRLLGDHLFDNLPFVHPVDESDSDSTASDDSSSDDERPGHALHETFGIEGSQPPRYRTTGY